MRRVVSRSEQFWSCRFPRCLLPYLRYTMTLAQAERPGITWGELMIQMSRAERKRIAKRLRENGKSVPGFATEPAPPPPKSLDSPPPARVKSGKPIRRAKPEK